MVVNSVQGACILGKTLNTIKQAELSAHSSGIRLQHSVYASCTRTPRRLRSTYTPHSYRQGAPWHCCAKLLQPQRFQSVPIDSIQIWECCLKVH